MATFPLEKLNDKEFEELSRDLLQKEFTIRLESFRRGRDKGIDLRYSTATDDNSIIIQAKHYQKSGIKKLLDVLKKKELPKVISLNPKRYVVITSLPLNPEEKEKIRDIFPDHIQSTSDIFGEDDINNSLSRFPELIKSHPKLYLGSLEILGTILNHHIRSRSQDKIKDIQSGIHLYVQNEKYNDAIQIINDEHFLVVTGEPGIGKTSLADFITYQHLAGGFRFTYILANLEDAEKMMVDDEKEIFYFDDFLGTNYLRIKHNPHSDAMLLNFINRVKACKNKRLILTTRTTILNQARSDFEKLKNPAIDLSRHETHIADYSKLQKARILYNHIYHSNLDLDFIENFVANKSYNKIVEHRNYNPRLIQYITSAIRLKNVDPSAYHEFIIKKLDNPQDIWLDPYESQISEAAKFLLQTLFTMPPFTPEQQVQEAFNERINYEVSVNGFQKTSNLYNRTLYDLLGGFIHRKAAEERSYLQFYNPSFADFMSGYLSANKDEVKRILNSLLYTDQFRHAFVVYEKAPAGLSDDWFEMIFGSSYRTLQKVKILREELLPIIKSRLDQLKPLSINKSRELDLAAFLLNEFFLEDIDEQLSDLMLYIRLSVPYEQHDDLLKLLDIVENENGKTYPLLQPMVNKILWRSFELCRSEADFEVVRNAFERHNINYEEFKNLYGEKLQTLIDDFWEFGEIDSRLNDSDFSSIYDEESMLRKLDRIESDATALNESLELEPSPAFERIFDWDYAETIKENIEDKGSRTYKADVLKTNENTGEPEEKQIENLFDNLLDAKRQDL